MNSIKRFRGALLAVIAMVLTMAIFPASAIADTLHMKDGRTLEGTVVKEIEGYVWFKFMVGGIEQTQMFRPSDISSIKRDVPGEAQEPSEPEIEAVMPNESGEEQAFVPGVPRIAIITLGEEGGKDMVGIYMTAYALKEALPLLEKEHVTDVIFRINSGGGALLEIQRLSDVIQNEYKPRFRVIAWIESAISAAAMTSHAVEDIYMMPQGNYGACTGWSGQLVAVKGRQLEQVLYMMEKISARGGHDPKIMRAMQIMEPLSCTIEDNGDVTWYQNETDGEYLVNPKGRILTFNSQDAERYHFSKGTAATYEELGKLLGYDEYEWVGELIPGEPFPISKAERLQREFRAKTFEDQERTREYFDRYGSSIAAAQGTPRADRGKFVNRARKALNQLVRMVKNNPNLALFTFNMMPDQFPLWEEEQRELLRQLMQ